MVSWCSGLDTLLSRHVLEAVLRWPPVRTPGKQNAKEVHILQKVRVDLHPPNAELDMFISIVSRVWRWRPPTCRRSSASLRLPSATQLGSGWRCSGVWIRVGTSKLEVS